MPMGLNVMFFFLGKHLNGSKIDPTVFEKTIFSNYIYLIIFKVDFYGFYKFLGKTIELLQMQSDAMVIFLQATVSTKVIFTVEFQL
jgi:hypothetical protein